MSTKFAPPKKSTKRPAICLKGAVGLPVVYVAGLPTSLSCFALATKSSGYERIAESFRLVWHPGPKHWRGASVEDGRNIEVIVTPLPGADKYEFELNVRDGPAVIGHHSWSNVHVDAGPPWNSGLMTKKPGWTVPGFQLNVIN